jgi:hypothetical protein
MAANRARPRDVRPTALSPPRFPTAPQRFAERGQVRRDRREAAQQVRIAERHQRQRFPEPISVSIACGSSPPSPSEPWYAVTGAKAATT